MCYNCVEYCIDMRHCDSNRPSFVQNNYFCDGVRSTGNAGCYEASPLWDGEDCGSNVDCTPPWFYRQLPELTSDDIEMRVCCDQPHNDEDVAIQAFEIYIQ